MTGMLDFRRHGSVSNVLQAIGSMMKTSGEQNSPEADSTIGARPPRYPLSGCVPAEYLTMPEEPDGNPRPVGLAAVATQL